MSQNRRNASDDMAEGIVGCVLMLMWAATAGLIALLWNWLKVQPEILLQELGTPSIWGKQIQPVACAHCATANEQGQLICFACGSPLSTPIATRKQIIKVGPFYKERLILAGVMILVLSLCTLAYIVASAGI